MDRLIIKRNYHGDCTLGFAQYKDFKFFTLELPWLDNQPNVSCVHPSIYKAKKYNSPTHGLVVLLEDKFGRTWIEIHAGNFTHQILGCILPGDSIKYVNDDGTPDVTNSKATLNKLMSMLPDEFEISIM